MQYIFFIICQSFWFKFRPLFNWIKYLNDKRAQQRYLLTITWHAYTSKWPFHWGQLREATVVKMAPTRPLASSSFSCSYLFATTDLSEIYNRETRRRGTACTETTDS